MSAKRRHAPYTQLYMQTEKTKKEYEQTMDYTDYNIDISELPNREKEL